MNVLIRACAFAALAFAAGYGVAYAPVLAFTAVAAAFGLALWWFVGDIDRSRPRTAAPGVAAAPVARPRNPLKVRLVSAYLFVWWVALIIPIATFTPRGSTSTEVATAVATGSLRNQLLVISFGMVGALFVPGAIRRFDPSFRWIVALWGLYVGWAMTSLLWSVYPPLTLRNAGALAIVSVGALGFGAGFYGALPNGRDLFLRHVFAAGVLSALVVLVPLPLHLDQYNLLDPAQRVSIGENVSMTKLVARPAVCAALVLVATHVLGLRRWRRRDWVWLSVLVMPLLVLKTRGPVLWGLIAMVVLYFVYRTWVRDRVLQFGALLAAGIGTYVYASEGALGPLVPYLTRGSTENTASLTGRLPLWETLIPMIGERPWLGTGYAAFWSPTNVYLIEQRTGFPWPSAHNGFLEELLNTGFVGLTFLVVFYVYALAFFVGKARGGDPLGWLGFLFLVFYLLLNLTNALFQEYLEVPLIVILATVGLMASGRRAPAPVPGAAGPRPGGRRLQTVR